MMKTKIFHNSNTDGKLSKIIHNGGHKKPTKITFQSFKKNQLLLPSYKNKKKKMRISSVR